jgi:hypothetical protein
MTELRGADDRIAPPDPVISLTDSPAYLELVDEMLGHAIEASRPIYPQPRLEEEEDPDAHHRTGLPDSGVLPGA